METEAPGVSKQMTSEVTWEQWAVRVTSSVKELADMVRVTADSSHDLFVHMTKRIENMEGAITDLYGPLAAMILGKELSEWTEAITTKAQGTSSAPDYFLRLALVRRFGQLRKTGRLEEKHQGRGRPILYRWKADHRTRQDSKEVNESSQAKETSE